MAWEALEVREQRVAGNVLDRSNREMSLAVLGVPSSAGAHGVGQEKAPAAFRAAGLVDGLRTVGLDVMDTGDLEEVWFRPDPAHPKQQNLNRVVAVASEVARRVTSLMRQGHVPIVLGGDCTITLGVAAGAVEVDPEVSLVYFDGDADLLTPATTRSGILDGMGMAHLLGLEGAASPLAGLGSRRPLLAGTKIAMVGFEESDLEEPEQALLSLLRVHRFPSSALRDNPIEVAREALSSIGTETGRIVHFDVDAIDSIDCPLANYPHFNSGVTLDVATRVLIEFCSAPNLAALVITEVNPDHDRENVELGRLTDSLISVIASISGPPAGRG
jgi:arginase